MLRAVATTSDGAMVDSLDPELMGAAGATEDAGAKNVEDWAD